MSLVCKIRLLRGLVLRDLVLRNLVLRNLVLRNLVAPMVAATVVAGSGGRAAHGQYGPVDPFDSSVRALREQLAAGDGEQHAALVALRELRDPTLRSLLEALARSDDWSLRVDGVLGLAELATDGKVDISLIESLPGESDRETSIGAAIALNLLDRERVLAMLGWADAPAPQRLMLVCEARRLGASPDAAVVARLTESRSPEIAAIAAALLLDMKADGADLACAKSRETVAALPPRMRATVVSQVAEACARNRLPASAPFVASLLALPDIPSDARLRALGSMLGFAPEAAYPLLRASVEADRSQTTLMRHATVMLASGVRAPKAEWDFLRNGDALIEGLADAGTALGEGRDADAYARLLALRHRISLRAAVDGSARLGESSERELGIASAKLLLAEKRSVGPLAESLLRAIARLAELAPEELRPLVEAGLQGDRESREVQESALLALAAAGSPAAAEVARAAKGGSSRAGEAMVAVLLARGQAPPAAEDLELLATVAGGGADVSPALRTQAAWLWLRHARKTDDATKSLTAAPGAEGNPPSGDAAPGVQEKQP